ncbi:MAG: glycosyltransferase family 1 protein [Silvibacterium sp.]
MDSVEGKIKISVFGPTDHTYSIDRYARELIRGFPPTVEAKLVQYPTLKGLVRKQIDRFWGYTRFAAGQQGDFNVVITEAYAYLLKTLPGRNTICVCHDMHGLTYIGPRTAQYRFYYLRYRWALGFLRQAKFIVTVSRNTKAELLKFCPFLPEEKIIPIHNGLEDHWRKIVPPEFRERFRLSHGLEQRRVILHIGNDLWYKNTAGLIRAFAQLVGADLILVHVGSLTPETLAVIRELNVGDRVVQLTDLSDDALAALYQIAEVFVFPSFSEGFGWPPLEAMACGCPTICSTAGSLREICGDASIFVNPADIADMANAIYRVLHEKDLRDELIAKGYAQAAKFSWKSTANTFLELFQRSQ